MESSGFRHRRSPSSERFLEIFAASPPSSSASAGIGGGGELNEAEVFWTGDFSEQTPNYQPQPQHHSPRSRVAFARPPQKSGILAVLPDCSDRAAKVLCRTASISPSPSSRTIPAIPRPPPSANPVPERECSQSLPALLPSPAHFQRQSAPVNVPAVAKAMAIRRKNLEALEAFEADEDEEEGEDKVLPPHEMAARGSGVSPMTTFSVLEGAGRTLKGRDLRQVRNAIWRRTGFLD